MADNKPVKLGILSRLFAPKQPIVPKDLTPEFVKELPPYQLIPAGLNQKAIFTDWNTANAIQNGYKASVFVYSCVNRLMKAAASVPWVVEVKSGDEWEKAPDTHPLTQLLRNPNPFTTWQNVIETITAQLYLGGNAIFYKVRVAGTPVELWIIRPWFIKPILDSRNYIKNYEYKLENKKELIPFDDIVHFMFVDPSNPFWGMGAMQAAANVVDTDIEAVSFNKISLQNRGVPDAIITFNKQLSKDQQNKAKEGIAEAYQGVQNARNPVVISGEAKWQQTSRTPVELDFLKSQYWTAERICAVFAVPPPTIGLYENATLANLKEANLALWTGAVIPYLDDIKDSLNHGLAQPDFGDDVRIVYDLSDIQAIAVLFTEKIEAGKKLFDMGVPFNTLNQRLKLGFDDIPGGNDGWVAANLQPADPLSDIDDGDDE